MKRFQFSKEKKWFPRVFHEAYFDYHFENQTFQILIPPCLITT